MKRTIKNISAFLSSRRTNNICFILCFIMLGYGAYDLTVHPENVVFTVAECWVIFWGMALMVVLGVVYTVWRRRREDAR